MLGSRANGVGLGAERLKAKGLGSGACHERLGPQRAWRFRFGGLSDIMTIKQTLYRPFRHCQQHAGDYWQGL